MIERDGEKLVWTARNIVRFFVAVAINNVVKISAVGEPETLIELNARALRMFFIMLRSRRVAGSLQPVRQ